MHQIKGCRQHILTLTQKHVGACRVDESNILESLCIPIFILDLLALPTTEPIFEQCRIYTMYQILLEDLMQTRGSRGHQLIESVVYFAHGLIL